MPPWDWMLGMPWCLLNHQSWPTLQSSVMGKKALNSFSLLLKILNSIYMLPAIAHICFSGEFKGNLRHFKSAFQLLTVCWDDAPAVQGGGNKMRVGKVGCKRRGSSPCTAVMCGLLRGAMHSQAFKEENTFTNVGFQTASFCLHCEWARIKLWFEMHLSCHLKTTFN